MIGSAQERAPYAIQVLGEVFRAPYQTEQLEKVLSNDVKMTAVGFIYGANDSVLGAYEEKTPPNVISLFKRIVSPEGTVTTGGMSDYALNEDHTWTVDIILYRSVKGNLSNCLITAICTLSNQVISKIEVEVEPYYG